MRKNLLLSTAFFLFCQLSLTAQKKKLPTPTDNLQSQALQDIQSQYDTYKKTALQIWDYAEVGYKEVKSSALLQQTLKENGFAIETGVAGIPTAFVATYGSGQPVIGILAEYDLVGARSFGERDPQRVHGAVFVETQQFAACQRRTEHSGILVLVQKNRQPG